MQDIITNIIGYSAAICGTLIMLPQVVKSFRTKKTGDLSMAMIAIYIVNCILWSVYGLLISKVPVIMANIVCLIVVLIQLVLKIKYDN